MERVKTDEDAACFFQRKGIIPEKKIYKEGHPVEKKERFVGIFSGVTNEGAAMCLFFCEKIYGWKVTPFL